MRIFTDQDVYRITINKLREWGHDVVTARDFNMARATDEEILEKARDTGRLLITRDKDFGALLCLRERANPGVILLRGKAKQDEKIHHQLQRLIEEHDTEELKHSLCVVEPNKYRIRRL